jgi:protein N-terminal methyltransferase
MEELACGSELWYGMANQFWSKAEPSINGVLSGLPELHEADVADSNRLLERVFGSAERPAATVLDCGAGIGRVSSHVLSNWFERIDLVEQCSELLAAAVDSGLPKLDRAFNEGLQTFTGDPAYYDCIWVQWVLMYLTDADMETFLERIQPSLTFTGLIIVKENIKTRGFYLDKEDNSLARSDFLYKEAFRKAGLRVIDEVMQTEFPEDVYKVKMWVLEPYSRQELEIPTY